jgi:hypothetical protein
MSDYNSLPECIRSNINESEYLWAPDKERVILELTMPDEEEEIEDD